MYTHITNILRHFYHKLKNMHISRHEPCALKPSSLAVKLDLGRIFFFFFFSWRYSSVFYPFRSLQAAGTISVTLLQENYHVQEYVLKLHELLNVFTMFQNARIYPLLVIVYFVSNIVQIRLCSKRTKSEPKLSLGVTRATDKLVVSDAAKFRSKSC